MWEIQQWELVGDEFATVDQDQTLQPLMLGG
jgi:hypothetical protein